MFSAVIKRKKEKRKKKCYGIQIQKNFIIHNEYIEWKFAFWVTWIPQQKGQVDNNYNTTKVGVCR